jgi:hypothetical protein
MDRPEVNYQSFWIVYRNLLSGLQSRVAAADELELAIDSHAVTVQRMNSDDNEVNKIDLIPNQKRRTLRDPAVGLQIIDSTDNNEVVESEIPYAAFSSDDSEEED